LWDALALWYQRTSIVRAGESWEESGRRALLTLREWEGLVLAWHDEEFGAVHHLEPRPALQKDLVGCGTALDFAAFNEEDAVLDVLVAVLWTRDLGHLLSIVDVFDTVARVTANYFTLAGSSTKWKILPRYPSSRSTSLG
jgi:hypothetical protein